MIQSYKSDSTGILARAGRFISRPPRAQYFAVVRRLRRFFPKMPIPLHLPFGAWWIAESDVIDFELLTNGFENAELGFVGKILKPGMTVLDIGAHHGLYTLLASKCVGRKGRVFAFEPSPRERIRLQRHIRLNNCKNVTIEPVALGSEPGDAELYLVEGAFTGWNSLRPPAVQGTTFTARVQVTTIDSWLAKDGKGGVDLVKLDVEGAELSTLKGASTLLGHHPRPIILVEVQ